MIPLATAPSRLWFLVLRHARDKNFLLLVRPTFLNRQPLLLRRGLLSRLSFNPRAREERDVVSSLCFWSYIKFQSTRSRRARLCEIQKNGDY